MKNSLSPCLTCTRVHNPQECENKNCGVWRRWFIKSWDNFRNYPRATVENAKLTPIGVPLGGRFYAHPHRVREYRKKHPCEGCYAKALCKGPCKMLIGWQNEGGEK